DMLNKEKERFIGRGVGMNILTAKEGHDINSMLQGTHILVAAREHMMGEERVRDESNGDSSQIVSGVKEKSGFVFGKYSLKELEGVKTELVLLARRALELSIQDFCVFDGLRTAKEQAALVAKGASQTMQSKHLKGLAIDLVPWINGKPV